MGVARRPGEWRTWIVAALGVAGLLLSGLAAASASAETVWLCKPGLANNPCTSSEETTVQLGNGSSFIEHAQPASNPPIDCFYVYPTVSSQVNTEQGHLLNANLEVDPEETQIAINQASRFSQACRVYAPMYPQLTLAQINTPGAVTPADSEKAYLGVLSAWKEYLADYNDGRGVVLIGHSQGALLLKQLVKDQIDPNPALRKQLVSAILLGGDVIVPKGKTVGGTFTNVPSCQTAGQTGCVVAYSSFLTEPPEGAFFGRVNSPLLGESLTEEEASRFEVLCVNPVSLLQGNNAGPLLRYESTSPFPGLLAPYYEPPKAATPWVSMPEQYSGQCIHVNGASWLQLTDIGPNGDPRELIKETLGPLWGTHLEDFNVALGNLVELAAIQSRVYLGNLQVTSITPTSGSTLGETAVTIRGSGFHPGATVKIGNEATPVNVVSETEITATTTATAAGSDEVVVTEANDTSTDGPSYTYYTSPPPTVVTSPASAVRSASATLNATVNPNGEDVSECKLEYGTTIFYGKSAPCTPSPGSGTSPVAVVASVAGLSVGSTYHFRISATTPGGTSKGSDEYFRTQRAPHWYRSGVKLAQGDPLPTISWGTITLAPETGPAVTCQTASLGYDENPAGGGAGTSETDTIATDNCVLSSGECKGSEGQELQLTAEQLPWASELEVGTLGGKEVVRDRTFAEPPSTPGFSSDELFLSTAGEQLTIHCVFRREQPEIKQLVEALCGRAFPGTSTVTTYNPVRRENESVEADGFEVYDIEAQTACSGQGLALEEAEVARRPSTPGDPASYDVPEAPVVQCEGEDAPHLTNGSSLAKPSQIIFDQPGTGTLACGPADEGTITGSIHSIGYEEGEVISAK
jgi:hypothetical protein